MSNIGSEKMILMLTADENWKIGLKGKMLIDLQEDLKRFKEKTTGNIVVMGRSTLEAIPGERALPNRINLVMTRNKNFNKKDIIAINSIENLFETLDKINKDKSKKVFVIGGESIVNQLLKYCTKAYITKILKDFKNHDTSIPNLDKLDGWKRVREGDIIKQDDVKYKYVDYIYEPKFGKSNGR